MPVNLWQLFERMLPEMERLGFEFTDLGAGSYAVQAMPADLEGINPARLIHEILADATEKEGNSPLDEIHKSLALSMARSAAIPQGQILSNEEMDDIVTGLFTTSNVNYTPDGRTILCILKQQEITRLFG